MNFCYKHIALCFLPLLAQCSSDDIAIFYNIYIPYRASDNAVRIVKEQLEHRKDSNVANAKLYYVTIENDIGELENCDNCEKIMHLNVGSEVDTLSHVLNYCTINQDKKVIYMHNKGSFHRKACNEKLRPTTYA